MIDGEYEVTDGRFVAGEGGALSLNLTVVPIPAQERVVRAFLGGLLTTYDELFEWRHPVDLDGLTQYVCRLLGVGESDAT